MEHLGNYTFQDQKARSLEQPARQKLIELLELLVDQPILKADQRQRIKTTLSLLTAKTTQD